jgi:hypothetical protein
MGPFERFRKLQFDYNHETISWQLQKLECFSFVRCNHIIFVSRFGHSNIVTECFDSLFEEIDELDDDYIFFLALQQSANNNLDGTENELQSD